MISIAQNEYLSVLIITLWKKENFGKDKIQEFFEKIKEFDNSYAAGSEDINAINTAVEEQFNFSVFISGTGHTRKEVLRMSALKAYTMISCLILNDVYDWTDARIKGFITSFKNCVEQYTDYKENFRMIYDQFGFKIS